MRVLFDQNAPMKLARRLVNHSVTLARNVGWEELRNGDLLAAAESRGFECLVTCDKNLAHQQNLKGRKIAIVVLPSGNWPKIEPRILEIVQAVHAAEPGSYYAMMRHSTRSEGRSEHNDRREP